MLVDTNILVYAVNTKATKHEKARDFLRSEHQDVVVAHQNILESLWGVPRIVRTYSEIMG